MEEVELQQDKAKGRIVEVAEAGDPGADAVEDPKEVSRAARMLTAITFDSPGNMGCIAFASAQTRTFDSTPSNLVRGHAFWTLRKKHMRNVVQVFCIFSTCYLFREERRSTREFAVMDELCHTSVTSDALEAQCIRHI